MVRDIPPPPCVGFWISENDGDFSSYPIARPSGKSDRRLFMYTYISSCPMTPMIASVYTPSDSAVSCVGSPRVWHIAIVPSGRLRSELNRVLCAELVVILKACFKLLYNSGTPGNNFLQTYSCRRYELEGTNGELRFAITAGGDASRLKLCTRGRRPAMTAFSPYWPWRGSASTDCFPKNDDPAFYFIFVATLQARKHSIRRTCAIGTF